MCVALKGKVNVAKVDVTKNRELGQRFNIRGFPTIKLLHKGESFEFEGSRTHTAMTDFATVFTLEHITKPVEHHLYGKCCDCIGWI